MSAELQRHGQDMATTCKGACARMAVSGRLHQAHVHRGHACVRSPRRTGPCLCHTSGGDGPRSKFTAWDGDRFASVRLPFSHQNCEPSGAGSEACHEVALRSSLGVEYQCTPTASRYHRCPSATDHAVMDTNRPSRGLRVTVTHPRANPPAYRAAPLATTLTVPALRSLEKRAADEARSHGDASVHHGYIISATRERAAAPDIVKSDAPVYEVVLEGRFTCEGCSIPPGAKVPTGPVMSSLDHHTLRS